MLFKKILVPVPSRRYGGKFSMRLLINDNVKIFELFSRGRNTVASWHSICPKLGCGEEHLQ